MQFQSFFVSVILSKKGIHPSLQYFLAQIRLIHIVPFGTINLDLLNPDQVSLNLDLLNPDQTVDSEIPKMFCAKV